MINTNYKLIKLTAIALLLSGCSTIEREQDQKVRMGELRERLETHSDNAQNGKHQVDGDYTKYIKNTYWVSSDPIKLGKAEAYPELTRLYSYSSAYPLRIDEIVGDLSTLTGIKFTIAAELLTDIDESAITTGIDAAIGQSQLINAPFAQDTQTRSTAVSTSGAADGNNTYQPSWVNTSLRSILDQLEAKTAISWDYDGTGSAITMYRTKTERYPLFAPSEKFQSTTAMTNKAISETSGEGESVSVSGATMDSTIELNLDTWSKIEDVIQTSLSPVGRVSTDKATQSVVVTDTKSAHKTVSKMIDNLNDTILQGIAVNLEIYVLTAQRSDLRGANLNVLHENAKRAVQLNTARAVSEGGASIVGQIVDASSEFTGTQLFLDSLETIGEVSFVDSIQRVTLNGVAIPIMQSRNRPYLRSVGSTATDGSSESSASLTDLVTGLGLVLRPTKINEDEMVITVSIDKKTAAQNFEDVDAGNGVSLERPDIRGDSSYTHSIVRNNQSMLISSSLTTETSTDKRGTIAADWWALGGSRESTDVKRIMIMIATPTLL